MAVALTSTRVQRSVGQGFFNTGDVTLGDLRLTYVYDCGSDNVGPLKSQILDYAQESDSPAIDLLFISHLDRDHINGLKHLLLLKQAKTVFLPYMTPNARLAIVAGHASNSTLDSDHLSFLCDPTRWLLDRGAESVIYIMPPPTTQDGAPNFTARDPESPLTPSFRDKVQHDDNGLSLDASKLIADEAAKRPSAGNSSSVKVISCLSPLRLTKTAMGMTPNWQFVTFVHPEGEREETFRRAVRREFGRDLVSSRKFEIDQLKLLKILQKRSDRGRLIACYRYIQDDRNLTSMSLYSGPIDTANNEIERRSLPDRLQSNGLAAWLATGDSNLKDNQRRKMFMQHFSSVEPFVSTFCLPHHGSKYSFHNELLKYSCVFLTSAGEKNKHGHPHDDVKISVSPRLFHNTTQDKSSAYFEFVAMLAKKP